jgi:6-phosphogluconolactonase (cycloisomerase 2 family)
MLWMIAGLFVFTATPTSAQETRREGFGKLKYLDSIFQPSLESANCARISADGKFVYIAAWNAKSIVVMQRDASTGRLKNVQTMQSERDLDGVTSIFFSPNGELAAAAALRSHTAVLLARNSETGLLRVLDVAREGEKAVKGLAWAVNGAFSHDARFVYICDPKVSGSSSSKADEKGAITAFQVTANRKLKWIETNSGQNSCFDNARSIVFHPSRKLAFVASSTANTLVVLNWIAETGKMTIRQVIRDGEGWVGALAGATELALSPDGSFLYVSSGRFKGDNAVSVFKLSDNDELAWVEEFISGDSDLRAFAGGNQIRVSPDGRNVYAAGTESHSLACFERDVDTGKLTYLETLTNDTAIDNLSGAAGVAISPDGKHVYVTAEYAGGVSIFERQTFPVVRDPK